MASEAEIQFVVDAIIDAGFTAETWPVFVERAKLETELSALMSDRTNMQAEEAAQNEAFMAELVALNDLIAAKQAEIDAL